jgi:hypothetical protein
MASLAAVNQLGESLVGLLRSRRNILAAEDRLGPVPATLDISHVSLSRLATAAEPTAGLTISCYRVSQSDHPRQRVAGRDSAGGASISLELHYLLAAWPGDVADEQAIITWAMLELGAHPVLDRSLLLGDGVWDDEETVQIVPVTVSEESLFRIWAAIQHKYRLSTTFAARVLRIAYQPGETWPPAVATRFGIADTDPMQRGDDR